MKDEIPLYFSISCNFVTFNNEFLKFSVELTPKSHKSPSPIAIGPLKGTLKSSLIFSEFPFRGQG